jgi:NTE family protein
MKQLIRTFTLSIVFLFPWNLVHSQQSSSITPPKVGLVLEGGSALGLAHIGVLRWLEEHHVPVSYVAGTSMGGLVGGMYSTGLSADELQGLIETIDWDELLQGQTPYQELSFRRKEDAFEYPNRLEFGLKKGLRFPEGFNAGQEVISILDRVALPYSNLQDFNELPTPFACVATDLVNSQKIVFRRGSLSIALRSTMSLPGLFTPVRWGGYILVDGGLLDNLPVDVAKSMGADVVLAVHLESAKLEPSAVLSSFGVLSNSTSVVIAANELRSIEKADILISVPLQKYRSLDFKESEEIIKAGYDAAEAKAQVLKTLSVDETTWKEYLAQRAARRRTAPNPEFIKVKGTTPDVAKALEKKLQENVDKPVDGERLQHQFTEMIGQGRLASLSYEMVEMNEQRGLLVTAIEKPYSPPIVQPLILLSGGNFAGVNFSMGARITFPDFGSYRTELRSDLMIGTDYHFASQYYRPFSETSKWFVAPNIFADYRQLPFYKRDNFLAQYSRTFAGGGLELGYEFSQIAQLSFRYTAAYQRYVPKIGDPTLLANVAGRFGSSSLRLFLNDVDNPVIPRRGEYALASWSWVDANPGAAHAFPLSEGSVAKFIQLDNPSSIYVSAHGGTTFGNALVGVPAFSLGGENVFVAYGENEILTNQYYQFQAGYLRRLVKIPVLLGDAVYLNTLAEGGKVFAGPFNSQVPVDGAVALIINTIFGPLEAGGAIGATGHRRVYFRLGRIF